MENSKILMIDKAVDESRKLKINLENSGYRVFISKTVEDGILIVNANDVDLIMLFDTDINLETIKANRVSSDLPIIAVLDVKEKDNLSKVLDKIDDYILRPFDKEQLYLKIRAYIKIKIMQDKLKAKDREVEALHKQFNDINLVDKVTGLYNNFYLKHIIQNECVSSKRYGYRLSGIILEVDNHFENESDYESVLKELVEVIRKNTRQNDTLVRLDSGEFYVLLPHTGKKDAVFVADKLQKGVSEHKFKNVEGVTVSSGITSLDEIERGVRKEEEMVSHAKEALKRAKQKGGNTIECY